MPWGRVEVFFNLGAEWGGWLIRHAPVALLPEKDSVPIVQEAGVDGLGKKYGQHTRSLHPVTLPIEVADNRGFQTVVQRVPVY